MEGNARQFHDLRHTGCTRMLEANVPFPLIAELMGWSPETTVRMAKRYGHIGQDSLRNRSTRSQKPLGNWRENSQLSRKLRPECS